MYYLQVKSNSDIFVCVTGKSSQMVIYIYIYIYIYMYYQQNKSNIIYICVYCRQVKYICVYYWQIKLNSEMCGNLYLNRIINVNANDISPRNERSWLADLLIIVLQLFRRRLRRTTCTQIPPIDRLLKNNALSPVRFRCQVLQ